MSGIAQYAALGSHLGCRGRLERRTKGHAKETIRHVYLSYIRARRLYTGAFLSRGHVVRLPVPRQIGANCCLHIRHARLRSQAPCVTWAKPARSRSCGGAKPAWASPHSLLDSLSGPEIPSLADLPLVSSPALLDLALALPSRVSPTTGVF